MPGTRTRWTLSGLLLAFALSPLAHAAPPPGPAPLAVPPPALEKIKTSDFADNELDLPYYVANFCRVANSVPLEGNLRGWVTTSVWRGNSNQHTYNARVLESQLTLTYFYCTQRPWNPYRGSPAVRARLEAMLERWCDMQGSNGQFSENGENRWSLAPTAFATKFMGESLRLLAQGPTIDQRLLERVKRAQRLAILATLTDTNLWRHGKQFANQFSNIYAGGLAWLALHPDDDEVRGRLLKRMEEAAAGLQSPAGYFYERDGPDWGYSLSTHHSNLHVAWHYARGTPFEPLLREEVRRFYDWLSWSVVIEPDGSGFILNRAIETRQRRPWVAVNDDPQGRNFSSMPAAEVVELARAFLPSREQIAAANVRQRAELERQWPIVPEMQAGNFRSYSPYAFLHRNLVEWHPTAEQQAAARTKLPYLRDGRFAHLRTDNRHRFSCLFVRRPNYYVAFNSGERLSEQQRYGLGLLWAPGSGALAQAQTGSNDALWDTQIAQAAAPGETGDLPAAIEVEGKEIKPEPGAKDLGDGNVIVRYPVGKAGRKTIRFEDDRIRVQTEVAGEFAESVPLLVREGDSLRTERNRVVLERGGSLVLAIEFDPAVTADLLKRGEEIGPYRVVPVRLKSKDRLAYSILVPRARRGS